MSNQFELLREMRSAAKSAARPELPPSGSPDPIALPHGYARPTTGTTGWIQLWEILRRRWRMSASFAALAVLVTMLFTFVMKPEYEASVRIEVAPPGSEIFKGLDSGDRGGSDSEYLQTQAKSLESDELAIAVMRQLRLDQNTEFTSSGWLSGTAGKLLRIRGGEQTSLATAAGNGTVAQLTPAESAALVSFHKRLKVNRDTSSRLIDVTFTAHDPVLSAAVANTVVNTFIARTFQSRHDAIMQSTEWLSRQLDDVRTRMEQSHRQLQQLQGQIGVSDIDSNRNTFTEQVADLSRQKTQAQGERIQLESYLGRVKSGESDALPQIQSNPTIQVLTQKLAETRAELSQASAVYGPKHPNSRKLQHECDELAAQIELQRKAILAQMETSYIAALTRENIVEKEVTGLTRHMKQMSDYATLKKEAEANSDLYNSLYAKIKEAGISAASKSSNLQIVDHARVLDRPTRPRPGLNFLLSLVLGLVGGVLLAFVREGLDNSIRTTEDVHRWTGISAISILPLVTETTRAGLVRRGTRLLPFVSNRLIEEPLKFLEDSPTSIQAEAMRGLYTSIMLSHPDRPPQTLLVASSLPNEGKTTVAVNLALALAQHGSTCLVEADLRKSGMARIFGLQPSIGLSEYLMDSNPLDTILIPVSAIPNLTLLLGGRAAPEPGNLLSSVKMRELLEDLRQRHDFVVVDSPPLIPYADGRALAPLVDGVIFVGLAGVVTRGAIARSMELLQQVHSAPIIEMVLNAAEMSTKDYSYYQKYS